MRRLLLVWLINAAALLALPYVVGGIAVAGFGTALVAALVLGLVNALIRPVLVVLTLPITLVTLGLFILVINALMFGLVAYFVESFTVNGFGSALLGALVYAVIAWALSALLLDDCPARR